MLLQVKRFISDKNGRIVIGQSPNILLSGWILCKLIIFLLSSGHLRSSLEQLSTALLFAWAYYEAAKGVSYFRKVLGVIVLSIIIIGFFR